MLRLRASLGCVERFAEQTRLLWSGMSKMRGLLPSGTMNSRAGRSGRNGRDEHQGRPLPTRQQQLNSLRTENFDVLVVGGGAAGCGCALEAASRGLKTALIERSDFGSGASCKSSKLIEGSNSYLHAAIQGADLNQIFMLRQVLSERAILLSIAPHLNRVQPMLMPIYSPLRLPFYWLGLKVYDAMAGSSNVRGSHFLSKTATLNEFPLLRREGLLGSLVYYDVQLDDARMCLALAVTAAKQGATVANYVRLLEMEPVCDSQGQCRTVLAQDELQKSSIAIRSRAVINATGAGTDTLRRLDDWQMKPVALPRLGVHIALPCHYGSQTCGLLFPSNELAGDPLVMLPFENRLLVGSLDVDRPELMAEPPVPTAEMMECLLHQTRTLLDECVELPSNQVLSAWAGQKPQILCPSASATKPTPVSNYLLEVSDNQMITLAGGRWSMYRKMAVAAVNMAIEECLLDPQLTESISDTLLLDGAANYCCMLSLDLLQAYDLPMDVAQHLAESYGTNASQVVECAPSCCRERLHQNFPYIQAEVCYACRHEYALHLVDVIARRLRVAFVDAAAAAEMLPAVLEIMVSELHWPAEQQALELECASQFLKQQMGLAGIQKFRRIRKRAWKLCCKSGQTNVDVERIRQNLAKCRAKREQLPAPQKQPQKESLLGRLKDSTRSWLQNCKGQADTTETESDCETDSESDWKRRHRPSLCPGPNWALSVRTEHPSALVRCLPEIPPAVGAAAKPLCGACKSKELCAECTAESQERPAGFTISSKCRRETCSVCYKADEPTEGNCSQGNCSAPEGNSRGSTQLTGEATKLLSSQNASADADGAGAGDTVRTLKKAVKALLEVNQLLALEVQGGAEPKAPEKEPEVVARSTMHSPRKYERKIPSLGRMGNSSVPHHNPSDCDSPT